LTPYEAGSYENGDRRFERIVRYATIDCAKAGWLVKHKGTWTLTQAGIEAYRAYPDSDTFHRQAVRLYAEWKQAQGVPAEETPTAAPVSERAPDEVSTISADVAYEQARESAWQKIEQFLLGMPPFEFQDLVGDLLEGMAYHVTWKSPPGRDGGVDIIAHVDPLGTQLPRIKVQVKPVAQKIDTDTLKAFVAVLNEDDVGIFVSTGGFTRTAEEFVRGQARQRVTLIDLERFVDLWVQHHGKLDDAARRRLPLSPVWFLTPEI